jgi:hypothetical protein
MMEWNSRVLEMYLDENENGDQGAIWISDLLKNDSKLKILSLRDNQFEIDDRRGI